MSFLIHPDEFLSRKDTYIPDESIKKKYQEIFSKYECFSKMTYFHRPSNKVVEKKKHIPSLEKKTHKKTFTSLWNILNESNYSKIAHRLKFMVTKENIETVVNDIVKMSIMHSIYRKYFLLILKDMVNMYCAQDILQSCIDKFDIRYFVLEEQKDKTCEYDLFCKMQKHKTQVLNTIGFLMDIIETKENLCDINISTSKILDTLLDAYKPYLLDEYYLDLFINSMITIASKYNEEVSAKIMENSVLWQDMLSNNTSKKIEFLMEKLLNITKHYSLSCS